MVFLYSIALHLYGLLLQLVAPLVPKAAQWVEGRRGLLVRIQQALHAETAPIVWFHCASLGEFEQGRPVMEAYMARHPHHRLVLTFFSPSGYEIRKNWSGADYVFYLPLDTAENARLFLAAVKPRLAVFVKYEFWYHFLTELERRQVPTICVSAIFRPEQSFFRPWGGFFRRTLGRFTHIFTQNASSVELLRAVGLTRASVAGDTRFDTVVRTASVPPKPLPLIEAFTDDWSPVFIIGSSWPEDLPALTPLFRQYADHLRFVVAPHEINETNLRLVEEALPGKVVRFSRAHLATVAEARLLLIDNVGMLSQLYRFGHFAYVGGAFGKGLHNTLEAAAFGLPLFFGPTYHKFQEAQDLVDLGCAFPIKTADELLTAFGPLYHREEARLAVQDISLDYVHDHSGATGKIMSWLERDVVQP
ncbi:3-deoxy-D-manno-octulosonic acid transferase [Hymenobacter mucosus]|uniref:3-deoxy-D-manno-octulosonic acid transferase n=1 Tax=Hymenobacter mucosus TaxID=1411120 RepID=A0A238VCE2_9BACT|nr:glycosyltransferase N-terminal domain-containing protein [Hymenobacter mucosus]SNR32055.1 3-deoxy-D-manno-octulosonic-acid transferase [Hymenobacter mucosus]